MEVGTHIREQRESAGISQEELARQIFVSRQTVSNWETGKTYPDVQSLLLLSNLFGVSVDHLVKGDVEAMSKEIENYELERFKAKAFLDGARPEDIPRTRKLPGAVRVALQATCGAVAGIALMTALVLIARHAAGLL